MFSNLASGLCGLWRGPGGSGVALAGLAWALAWALVLGALERAENV